MKKKDIIFIVILIVIVFGLYWKTFNYDLIWDSKYYFKQNILLTENYPIGFAFKIGYLHSPLGESNIDFYYRPLLTASYMIENKLWGIKNTNLRLTNCIIYILSLIFFFIFFKNQSEKKYFPEIATLLFALYPLNLDNIVWIVGRSDLLLLLWGSLTFLFLEFFVKKGKYYFLILSSFFYLLGILSKESFLFFLPILLLYELIKRKRIFIPYHLSNVFISIFFFILKNKILGAKNLSFIVSPSITENIKVVIATLGYYFRTTVFPFYYDLFIPLQKVMKLPYLLLGILSILLLAYLLYKSKRDRKIIIPLSFIIIFISSHLLLVFAALFPFKIYSRYMMIPALGFVWIFVKFIGRLKEKVRLSLVFIILLLFIFSIVINTYSYKTELSFFQRANKSFPENGYILFQMAKTLYEKQDNLAAELVLNKALSYRQNEETAMMLSLLYADIELRKADYKKVFKWLENVENFESLLGVKIDPFTKFLINNKKALVYFYQGNTYSAERLLEENIEKYKNRKESYKILYQMYIGHHMWEKATELEKNIKGRFPSLRSLDTIQIKRKFSSLSAEEKISFYISYRNFNKAIEIIKSLSPIDFDYKILLSKLYYWAGKEEEAKKTIDEILFEYSDDFRVLNKIGNFYLNDFIRVKEALLYFKKSLEINKNQSEILNLVINLTENYMNKLNK